MRISVICRAVSLAVALVCTVQPAANAVPDTAGEHTITILVPDPTSPTSPPCRVNLTMSSSARWTPPTVRQWGFVRAEVLTAGCTRLTWHTRMTIIDESPGHATRVATASGAAGTQSTAVAGHYVAYGIGERELGVITFQFEAWSGDTVLCFQDIWTMDAVTRQPRPSGFGADCA